MTLKPMATIALTLVASISVATTAPAQSQWSQPAPRREEPPSRTRLPDRTFYVWAPSKGGDVEMRSLTALTTAYCKQLGWRPMLNEPSQAGGLYELVFSSPAAPALKHSYMGQWRSDGAFRAIRLVKNDGGSKAITLVTDELGAAVWLLMIAPPGAYGARASTDCSAN